MGALTVAAFIGVAAFLWHRSPPTESDLVFQPALHMVEPAPLCPWREPESDRVRFFPDSTRAEAVTLILSGRRVELQQRLGRIPGPEENALAVHRVYTGDRLAGAVLTRRVKGEHGAIELVLAVGGQGRVRGLRLQRLREPETVAKAITDPAWLASFQGNDADRNWQLAAGISDLPEEARASGQAICDGVRSLLILLSVAPAPGLSPPESTHAHAVY
jgi:hypothetical protein